MIRTLIALWILLCLTGCSAPVKPPGVSQAAPVPPAESDLEPAEYQLSLAYTSSEDLSNYQEMADRIFARSEGQLSIALFPGGILGNEQELIWAVQNGTISMTSSSLSDQLEFVPQAAVADIPACFQEYWQPFTVYDGIFGQKMGECYRQAGMELICLDTGNVKVLSSRTPIRTLADLEGLAIRIPANQYHHSFWTLLNANPTSGISFGSLYNALQEGAVDGQENSLRVIWDARLYEVQDYVLDLPLFVTTRALVINQSVYDSLPGALQTILREEALAEAYGQQEHLQQIHQTVEAALSNTQLTVLFLPQEAHELLRQQTQPVLHAIRDSVGADLLDALIQETREKTLPSPQFSAMHHFLHDEPIVISQ